MGVLFEVQSVLFCLFGIGGFRASENTTRKRVDKSFFFEKSLCMLLPFELEFRSDSPLPFVVLEEES